MIPTLLFDLDGTLAETDWAHLAAFVEVYADYGLPMDEHIFKTQVMGRPNVAIGQDFFPQLPVAERDAIFERKEAVYRRIVGQVSPVAGAVALLDWADAHGVLCGVVTNAPRENANMILKGAGLFERFGTIVCGQELAHGKPHPMAYMKGLADLGGEAAVSVAFEDSPAGMASAIGAGLPVVGMTTNLDAAAVLKAGATLAAPDYTGEEVLSFIRRRTGRG